jgi:hypothetical protein
MRTNKPQLYSAGSAVRSIQGSAGITNLNDKHDTFADSSVDGMKATVNAYQADE